MDSPLDRLVLSAHILRVLAVAQRDERLLGLDDVVDALEVRRADVRACLSQLHEEGLIDVLRMRLTLEGFAFGSALAQRRLRAIRQPARVAARAA